MPEPSSPSMETISGQDYIPKTLAITYLEELLQDERIDEETKNRILDKFRQNILQDSHHTSEGFQDVSLTVIASVKQVEIIGSEKVKYELGEVVRESVPSDTGKSIFRLHIRSCKSSDEIDCPPNSRPRIVIRQPKLSPVTDGGMIERPMMRRPEVLLMRDQDPIDRPPGSVPSPTPSSNPNPK